MHVYLRITVDGVPKELAVKRDWEPGRWSPGAGRAIGTKEDARTLNTYLDVFQSRVYDAKRQLLEAGRPITADAIKAIVTGNKDKDRMLIGIFSDYNDKIEKLIGIDYSKATWTKYDRTRRFTADFIRWKYKAADIVINRLNMEFINDLEFWLKTERKCCQNTTAKYISILKMIVLHCVSHDWLAKDPFIRYEIVKEEVIPQYLTKEEIQAIASKKINIERLSQVRDVFLFCCYTGLAYVDVAKLNKDEVSQGVDGELWIFTKRGKTNVPSRVPLLPAAVDLLSRYKEYPPCVANNKVLPVLSNQKYNSYLKEIADICGIKKNLTTHTARHTFATTITLSNGVPIESVSKMLGHKKIQTTQHYARVLDIKVSEDMKLLRSKFGRAD